MRVHDSQAYTKMVVTRDRVHQWCLGTETVREILLSFQTGFSLISAAVVCAILESVSGLEPSSVMTEPRYLKVVAVSSFCLFTLISVLMPLVVVCHQLGLLGTDLHAVGCGGFVETHNRFASSSSSPARPSMSSTKRKLVIVQPPMLTVPS